jgi:hypothetical protein
VRPDATGGEQGLEETLGREAARIEDEREEPRVLDVYVVERLHPRPLALVVALERLLRTTAVDDLLALVGRDAPVEWRKQTHVDSRGMFRQKAAKAAGA